MSKVQVKARLVRDVRRTRVAAERFASRCLTTISSPTADLYFGHVASDGLESGRIVRNAPTIFSSGSTDLVVRHDARGTLRDGNRNLIYLIDDAWEAGATDPTLSHYFRMKNRIVEARAARWYLPRADVIVTGSDHIAEAARRTAPQAEVLRLDPFWNCGLADLDHFDTPGFDVAFLGAQLHRTDLQFLFPVFDAILARFADVTITLSAGHALPRRFRDHPRIRRIGALRWSDYRSHIPGERFHLALYPLGDTPFNAGRSINKLIEHAVVGAAGLYSDVWAPGRSAALAGAGLSLPREQSAWIRAISDLYHDRDQSRELAKGAHDLACRMNDGAHQRNVWSQLFGFDIGAS